MNDVHRPVEGKQVLIKDATKEQLRAFCVELGIPVTNFMTVENLRDKIFTKGNWVHPFIVVYGDKPAKEPATPGSANGAVPSIPNRIEEPMCEIRLHKSPGEGGDRLMFVGVNGVGILIPRNTPCKIKHRYWTALTNAIETQFSITDGNYLLEGRDIPATPFDTLRTAPEDELAAWTAYKQQMDANARQTGQRAIY